MIIPIDRVLSITPNELDNLEIKFSLAPHEVANPDAIPPCIYVDSSVTIIVKPDVIIIEP